MISRKPYGLPAYKQSDEIHIQINFQDLILDIARSYIYIEGTFKNKGATKPCYLTNNALAFLYDEIRYAAGGEVLETVRKPGITLALKILVSDTDRNQQLLSMGWSLNRSEQSMLDAGSRVFTGKLSLKHLIYCERKKACDKDLKDLLFQLKQINLHDGGWSYSHH